MSKAHDLAMWIASTIGLASLAGQFYIHQYNNVIFIIKYIISISYIFQAVIGNLHLATSVISLLAYFSRRDFLMAVDGHVVSVISTVSIMIGGMVMERGNMFSVVGSGLIIAAKLFNRFENYFLWRMFLGE